VLAFVFLIFTFVGQLLAARFWVLAFGYWLVAACLSLKNCQMPEASSQPPEPGTVEPRTFER
jgi:hypothetical protein